MTDPLHQWSLPRGLPIAACYALRPATKPGVLQEVGSTGAGHYSCAPCHQLQPHRQLGLSVG